MSKQNQQVRGKKVALAEIQERGRALRLRMVTAGFPQYAAQFLAWAPRLEAIDDAQDRIRQIGLGRGHHYDLELLTELERIAARRLAKVANAA